MAVANRVANATQNFLMPKLVEGVLTGNVGLSYFLVRSKAGVWKGAQTEVAFKNATNPNGGSFTGLQTLATAEVDNSIKLTYDCKFNYQTVALAATDLSLNDTEKQVADLLERQIASDTYDLADKIGTQFYADGTGNGGLDITGLGAIVDDGTSVTTIGGQSRTTYPQLNATVTATGGALTLARMYTMDDAITEDGQTPDLILTTKTVKSLYNQLLEPKEQFMIPTDKMDQLYLGTGATMLAFRGKPVMADSKCTSGVMFFLNSKSFQFQSLPGFYQGTDINYAPAMMDGEPSNAPKGLGFKWTGFRSPTNQLGIVGQVVHAGNFVAMNPRFNGKLTGITSI